MTVHSLPLLHLDLGGPDQVLAGPAEESAHQRQGQVSGHDPRIHYDHYVTPRPHPAQAEQDVDYQHGEEGDGAERDHLFRSGGGDVEVLAAPAVEHAEFEVADWVVERPAYVGQVL